MDKCRLGRVAPVVGGVDGEHRRDLLKAGANEISAPEFLLFNDGNSFAARSA